jgi:enoyl-CoA hydratase/carnithine racemase
MSNAAPAQIACSHFSVAGQPLTEQLAHALETAIAKDETKAIILELEPDPADFDVDQFLAQEQLFERFRILLRKLEVSGKPIVGLIRGPLQWLQLEIALACHTRFAPSGSIQLAFPGLIYGLMPVLGATQRLPRIAGISVATRMLLKGDRITVADAPSWISVPDTESAVADWIQRDPQPKQPWDTEAAETSPTYSQSAVNRHLLENVYLSLRHRFTPEEIAPTAILRCFQDGLERSIDPGIRLEAEQWAVVKGSRSTKNRIETLYRTRMRALAEGIEVKGLDQAKGIDGLARVLETIPVVTKGDPFKTHVTAAYVQEAILMLGEGTSPWLIDNVALNSGMIIGPLAMADLSGLDQLLEQTLDTPELGTEAREAIRILSEFTNRSRLGRKTNAGIYDYDAKGNQSDWAELSQIFMRSPNQPPAKEIEQRLFAIQAIEALRCVKEGIVKDSSIADLASVLGWNYPAGKGGVLAYTEYVDGFPDICADLRKKLGERFALPLMQNGTMIVRGRAGQRKTT